MKGKRRKDIEELSAGGLVYRKKGGKYEFLIGKHSGYHKWVLPKGLVEEGEGLLQTAVREVEEELGVRAKVVDIAPLATVEYYYFADLGEKVGEGAGGKKTERRVKKYQEEGGNKVRVHKRAIYYLMEMEEDNKKGWEMKDKRWVSYGEGMKTLAFPSERGVLEKAREALGVVS